MSKKCFVKFKFINAFKGSLSFKRALKELGISEEGLEVESYEQLSSKLVSLLSKLLSEQQAFFSLYGTDQFASIDNTELRGQFLNKPALAQAVKEQEQKLAVDLKKLFEAAESGNGSIDLILSKFITNDILSVVLEKLDHYEKNKHKYRGPIASAVEGYLIKTLNWLSIALADEKAKGTGERLDVKNDIHKAILKINQYLNNQVKFAFPLYVQLPFGYMNNEDYIDNFYIDSEDDANSEMVANPIDREITQSIIELQKSKLRSGETKEKGFGIARAYQEGGKTLYKLYRAKLSGDDIIYEEVLNKFSGENKFDPKNGELFQPDLNKVSPFSIDGEADFTNFVSNFDGIIPKRVGNKAIPEHNPKSLQISISKNLSVDNNLEIQTTIKSILDSLRGGKGSIFSSVPVFLKGRERFIERQESVIEYKFIDGEIQPVETLFEGLVTKGLNNNIDIILYDEGKDDTKTFIGDYDPMNYVKVTAAGAEVVPLESLKDENFIVRYFSLPPGIRINDSTLNNALIEDLTAFYRGNKELAINKLASILGTHKKVVPLQFIQTLVTALEDMRIPSQSALFYNKTIESFRTKVSIVENAENLFKEAQAKSKDKKIESLSVKAIDLGLSGHKLDIFPNINKENDYSESFDFGGKFNDYQVISWKQSDGKIKLEFHKDGEFLHPDSNEYEELNANVRSILSRQPNYKESDQITLLYYSGTRSNAFVPMFLSVKPSDRNVEGDFLFSALAELKTGSKVSKVRVSLPLSRSETGDSYIGGFSNNSILKIMNLNAGITEDLPSEFKFNILGLAFKSQAEAQAFSNVADNVVDKKLLTEALTDYYFKLLEKYIPENKGKKVIEKDSEIIPILNQTFLKPTDDELGLSDASRKALGLKTTKKEIPAVNLYNSRTYIAKRMALVADAIKGFKDKEIFNSVTAQDFKNNTAFEKLRHNIDINNPIHRVLRFNVNEEEVKKPGEFIEDEGTIAPNIEDQIDFNFDDYQYVAEKEYTSDRALDDLAERKKFLDRVAGTTSVEDMEKVKDRLNLLQSKNVPLGVVMDSIVYMNEQLATQGNFYHEAAHRVFDYLLTSEERAFYLNEAKNLPYTEEYIDSFLAGRGLPNTKENIDLFYREQIMNLFAQYRLDRDNASFWTNLGYWLKDLFDTLLSWLNISKNPSLNQLFRDMDKGAYRNRTVGKSEPLFQNLITKHLPLDTESTENLFYHLYGTLINEKAFSNKLENYKLTRNISFLREFIDDNFDKVLKLQSTVVGNKLPEVFKNMLNFKDNINENLYMFKEFVDERIFEQYFTPEEDLSEEYSEDEIQANEVNEDPEVTPKDTGFNKSKYNEELFIEPKVKTFVNTIVSHEITKIGNNESGIPQIAVIYKKVSNRLVNKAQKDFSVAPLGTDKIQHFLTYLDAFSRYDSDYAKLQKSITTHFQVTKENDTYTVGKNWEFLLGLVKNFSQNRIYYSKVISKKGSKKSDTFGSLDEQELILDKNANRLNNLLGKMGRVPEFHNMNIISYSKYNPTTKTNNSISIFKDGEGWTSIEWIKGKKVYKEVSNDEALAAYEKTFNDVKHQDFVKIFDETLSKVQASLSKYQSSSIIDDLDGAVYGFKFLFSLLGMPINSSYAYMMSLNSLESQVSAGKLDFLGALYDLSKIFTDTSKTSFKQFFNDKFSRTHPSLSRYVLKMKEKSDVWFHAMINGTNLSYNSVKGVDGKSYYAYSYNNITSKLEMSNDERFLNNNILRAPYFRIANMMVNQGIKKEFKNMDEHEIFAYMIALYKKGFYNLDQLEANSTNFSVKGDKKSYFKYNTATSSFEITNESLGSDLAQQYRDVANSMQELLDIYEEAQGLLNEVSEDADRIELLDYINEKYDLTLNVSALSLDDLDKGIISDKAFNKLGFNTFFNLLPVRQLKTKQEVLDYIELVKTKGFEDSLINAVFGKRDKVGELNGLAGNIWRAGIEGSSIIPKSEIQSEPFKHLVFVADMTANYLSQTHLIYKKILGEKYYHAFKSSNTGEFNKRLKALAIFGQDLDEANYIETKDILEELVNIHASNWKEDNAYTTNIVESGKDVLESTDGAGLITFERAIQVQKSKSRLDDNILSYYVSLITENRFVYDGDVQTSDQRSLEFANKYARKSNAVNGLFKTALGDSVNGKFRYHKMAYIALPRGMYQRVKEDVSEKELSDAYLDVAIATVAWLKDYNNFEAKNAAYTKLYSLLEAIPGQEKVFNIYKNMETNNLQGTIFRSASKAYKTDNVIKIPYGAEKHQTENTNFKKEVSESTQAVAGILTDQGNTVVWDGEKVVNVQEVIQEFIKTKARINDNKASILLGTLTKDGRPNIEMLSYYLKKYVSITRNKDHLESLFDISYHKGVPRFNTTPDNPEAISILLTLVAKIINDVNTSKLKGDAYGLVPPVFYSVQEDEKGYVPLKYRENSSSRTLRPRQLVFNGTWNVLPFTNKQAEIDRLRGETKEKELPIMEVHEMVIPAHEVWQQEYLIDRDRMRQGEITKDELDYKYPLELFLVYGTRIPHEEKRSGAVGLIVDFFPPNMGSFAMIATAKMSEDGHDNDNDKIYTYKPFVVKEKEGWRIKKTPNQSLWNKVKNNPFLKQKIEKELATDTQHINNIREIERLKSEIDYYKKLLLDPLEEDLSIEPIVEDTEMPKKDLERSIYNQILSKYENKYPELLDAAYANAQSNSTITISEILKQYEEDLTELELNQKVYNQRKSRLVTTAVKDVEKFNAYYGIDPNIDSEVEQNKLLSQFIALHSNRHTLEQGLTREQTNLDHAVTWTKNEIKRNNQTFGYEVIGSPMRVARNIYKSVEGGQGISIFAKFVKTLHDLKVTKATFPKLPIAGKRVNNVNTSNRFVKQGKLFVKNLNNRILEYNKKNETSLSPISEDVENYKRNNLKTSLYVSVATDAIKNQFGIGLNLNKITYPVYAVGVAFNIPQAMLMAICTSSYIRGFSSLKEMKDEAAMLTKGKGRDTEGKILRTPPLTSDDILDLYFIDDLEPQYGYRDFEYTNEEDSTGKKVAVYKKQVDGKSPILNPLGMLKLQALTLVIKLNKNMSSLFSVGSITNSDKAQQIDAHLITTSLLNSKWNSTDDNSLPITAHLGVEATKNFSDKSFGFSYEQAIPNSRINNVQWTARVMQLFSEFLDLDKKDNVATELSKMLGIENQNYQWFDNMSSIIHNTNAYYDVTRLKGLKIKLNQINEKYNNKILLINKLRWENGIFYVDKDDNTAKDIVSIQEQLGNINSDYFPVIAELLQATRYIYGWKGSDFSPIYYFPGKIVNMVQQERSKNIEDYIPELERELTKANTTLKTPYFASNLPVPVRGGKQIDSFYLDKNFNNNYTIFRLNNLPLNVNTYKYMSKGVNIYKRLSLTEYTIDGEDKRKAAVYALLRKPRPALISEQSFNPFFQSRVTNLDVFRMKAKENPITLNDIPRTMIYNNYLIMYSVLNNGKIFGKSLMEKNFLNKLTTFTYDNPIKKSQDKAEIGIIRDFKKVDKDFKGTVASFWKNTVFDDISSLPSIVGVFEVETNFPKNQLINIEKGKVSFLGNPDIKRIENTFVLAPHLSTATSNLDISDMVEESKEQEIVNGAFTGHVDQEMFGPNDVMVFGADEEGFHGQGMAALAYANTTVNYRKWNPNLEKDVEEQKVGDFAIAGKTGLMEGNKGWGYGLVTVSAPGVPLDTKKLSKNIRDFYKVAREFSFKRFIVPYNSDSNLNNLTLKDLAVLFGENIIPPNVVFGDKMTQQIVGLYGSSAFNDKLSSVQGILEEDVIKNESLVKPNDIIQEEWDMMTDQEKLNLIKC